MTFSPSAPGTVLEELEAANRLLIQQVFKPISNEYRISIPALGSSEEGPPLLYVKQKRMKIKEDIRFRLTPDGEEHLFMIKSKSVFEFRGRHEVLDADGAVIGLLEKDFTRSLLRSHWHVRDAAGEEILEAHEASWIISLVRRFAALGPDIFSLLEWLPFNLSSATRGSLLVTTSGCSASSAIATCSSSSPRSARSTDASCSPSRSGWTRCRIASRRVARVAGSARGVKAGARRESEYL